MSIIGLQADDASLLNALARLTFAAAQLHNPFWLPTLTDAMEEVQEAFEPDKICRVMMMGGVPVGWVCAFPRRHGIWELHPLLIAPAHQRKGYGTSLVAEIERLAAAAGASSMILSTVDAMCRTTIGGIDLYDDPLARLSDIDVTDSHTGHAFQFWRKAGYSVVGVLPDAEGPGIPSIQLAKKLK